MPQPACPRLCTCRTSSGATSCRLIQLGPSIIPLQTLLHSFFSLASLFIISLSSVSRVSMRAISPRLGPYSLAVQCGHRWCILLISPQAGHLHREFTSFNALPAICLCLFFMCDVFFLGTALRIDSQMSSRIDGIDGRPSWKPTGTARVRDGKSGSENWRTWSCILDVEKRVGERSLGRKELAEAILIAGAANAISKCGKSDENRVACRVEWGFSRGAVCSIGFV